MLKMTKTELELISDIDIYSFIHSGGISYIAKRHSKANNKYMQSCDVHKPSKFTMYLDVNNLYGSAMSQNLLYGGFKWLNQKEINKFAVNSIEPNCIDLEYSDELRKLHNNYPLAS